MVIPNFLQNSFQNLQSPIWFKSFTTLQSHLQIVQRIHQKIASALLLGHQNVFLDHLLAGLDKHLRLLDILDGFGLLAAKRRLDQLSCLSISDVVSRI